MLLLQANGMAGSAWMPFARRCARQHPKIVTGRTMRFVTRRMSPRDHYDPAVKHFCLCPSIRGRVCCRLSDRDYSCPLCCWPGDQQGSTFCHRCPCSHDPPCFSRRAPSAQPALRPGCHESCPHVALLLGWHARPERLHPVVEFPARRDRAQSWPAPPQHESRGPRFPGVLLCRDRVAHPLPRARTALPLHFAGIPVVVGLEQRLHADTHERQVGYPALRLLAVRPRHAPSRRSPGCLMDN